MEILLLSYLGECEIKYSTEDRNNTSHQKPSDIKKAPIRSEPLEFMVPRGGIEPSTRGFSVLCSDDSVSTGPSEVTVFVWAIRSVMDWRDKDYQSLILKKAPLLIHKAYYFRTTDHHECPVQRSLNSYSYGWFGSKTDSQ